MFSQPSATAVRPLVSILVPAYNEGPEIAQSLTSLRRYLSQSPAAYDYEIIVIDDGSTDDTYEAASLMPVQDDLCVRIVRHAGNRGLGCAIRTGFAAARGSIAIVFDADLSYAPEIIPRLLEQMERNHDDLVLASPYMRGGKVLNVPFMRRVLSREANRFLSFATNGRYATLTCMVRAYRLTFFRSLNTTEERMEINPEVVFKAISSGARVSEIPAVLEWSAQRVASRGRISLKRTFKQIAKTMGYGIAYRPALLLALPGLLPGLLPLVIAIVVLLHLSLTTSAIITGTTVIIQYASFALFAGQVAVFGRNVHRKPALSAATRRPGPYYKRPEI